MIRLRAFFMTCLVIPAFALLSAGSPATAAPMFPNPVYTAGSNPYGLALADFDGDGLADMVVSNYGAGYDGLSGDLSLRLGVGDGTFGDETRVLTSQHATNVLAADVDHDGRSDLILSYWPSGEVVWKRGLGDATFGPETLLLGEPIYVMRLADFNHDGMADLVTELGLAGGGIRAYLGRPDGSFSGGPVFAVPGAYLPTTGDFNGDGRDDVAALRYDGQSTREIVIALGVGDGTFQPAASLTSDREFWNISAADVDGDGYADLGVQTGHPHESGLNSDVTLYFSNGDGTFVPGIPEEEVYLIRLIAADLNGDGIQDYVRVSDYDVTPMLGRGGRTYEERPYFYTGARAVRALTGDFDRDGHLDLALLDNWLEAVFLYAGDGGGGFGPPVDTTIRDSYLGGLATDDFNGDGLLDMAAAVLEQDQVAVKIGNGDGTFGAETRFAAGVGPLLLASADMNGDGRKDLVVLNRNWHFEAPIPFPTGNIGILTGNGDGTFGAPVFYEDPGLLPASAMHVRDLDGDGDPDVLVTTGTDSDQIAQPELSYFRNNGDGTLTAAGHLSAGTVNDYPYGWTYPTAIASGDFNGDGTRDIVVSVDGHHDGAVRGTVQILDGLGGGAFAAPFAITETVSSTSLAVGDLNGDGTDDIAVTDQGWYVPPDPGGVYVLLNDGAGGFARSGPYLAGNHPFDVQIMDLTQDGIPDVVSSSGYLSILPGLGGGAFGPAMNFGLFGTPLSLVTGDFDGDGQSDVLVVSSSGTFVMRNQSIPALRIEARISFTSPLGRGSGTISWTTNAERNLRGFNVLEITSRGMRTINPALLGCEECVTGVGATYSYYVPRHRSGRDLYIQAVRTDGTTETFGPARRE